MSGETESNVSGWTVDTLREYMLKQHEDLKLLLTERYETQTKAVDKAFRVQETAMQTALTAAERAVSTALLSAEKAVTKAEIAADKRFESVNEFRGQLADQVSSFPTRNEVDTRLTALGEKLDTQTNRNADRINELELRVNSRLDLDQGSEIGATAARVDRRQMINLAFAGVSLVLVVAGTVLSIFLATKGG